MKPRLLLIFFCLGLYLSACNRQAASPGGVDMLGTAAAEATYIIQQAQATALVLDAQRQATALVAAPIDASGVLTPTPGATAFQPVSSPGIESIQTSSTPSPSAESPAVEILGVRIGAEGNFIEVDFLAPPAVAGSWYQGIVSVTDEGTGTVYNEVPVIPVVGPLFGKPVQDGQRGYVMFVNGPAPLQSGALVTVTLGEYIFKHLLVK